MASVTVQLSELFVAHIVAAGAAYLGHSAYGNANASATNINTSITALPPVSTPTAVNTVNITDAAAPPSIGTPPQGTVRLEFNTPWMKVLCMLLLAFSVLFVYLNYRYIRYGDDSATELEDAEAYGDFEDSETQQMRAHITRVDSANTDLIAMAEPEKQARENAVDHIEQERNAHKLKLEKSAEQVALAKKANTKLRTENAELKAEMMALAETDKQQARKNIFNHFEKEHQRELVKAINKPTPVDAENTELQITELRSRLTATLFQINGLRDDTEKAKEQAAHILKKEKDAHILTWQKLQTAEETLQRDEEEINSATTENSKLLDAKQESDEKCGKLEKGMATLKKNMSSRKAEAVAEAMAGARDIMIRILDERDVARRAVLTWKFSTIWRRKISSNANKSDDSNSGSGDKKPDTGDDSSSKGSRDEPDGHDEDEGVDISKDGVRPDHQDDVPSDGSGTKMNGDQNTKTTRGTKGNNKAQKAAKRARNRVAKAAIADVGTGGLSNSVGGSLLAVEPFKLQLEQKNEPWIPL